MVTSWWNSVQKPGPVPRTMKAYSLSTFCSLMLCQALFDTTRVQKATKKIYTLKSSALFPDRDETTWAIGSHHCSRYLYHDLVSLVQAPVRDLRHQLMYLPLPNPSSASISAPSLNFSPKASIRLTCKPQDCLFCLFPFYFLDSAIQIERSTRSYGLHRLIDILLRVSALIVKRGCIA